MNWTIVYASALRATLAIKYRIIIVFIIIAALLGTYLIFEPTSYKTSWIMLLPGKERASTISIDNLGEAKSTGANAYGSVSISPKNTYKEIALSDAVIKAAAKVYGVDTNAFSKPRITLIDQTPAMQFTLIGEDAEELAYRANLYNTTFHEILDGLRSNEIERNYEGIENNLAEAKKRLTDARKKIIDHQIKQQFKSADQFDRWIENAEDLRSQTIAAEIEVSQLKEETNNTLRQLDLTIYQAQAIARHASNPSIKIVLEKLGEQLTERASARSQYASKNPIRVAIERDANALIKRLQDLVQTEHSLANIDAKRLMAMLSEATANEVLKLISSVNKLAGLEAKHKSLVENQQISEDRINDQTKNASILADLQRDHQIAEAIFSSALAKLDTSRLDIYATYPLTQLLTQPGATIERDRLKTKIFIVTAILVFGMLSMAMILYQIRKTILSNKKNIITTATS